MRVTLYSALLILGAGCNGSFGTAPGGSGGGPTVNPRDANCPVDPDCAIGGDCSLYECPDYWICEDLAISGKRCTSPGPEYPDESGDWDCWDEAGRTICRGDDYPDDGGGSRWNCEESAEFVECTTDNPDYPDDGAGGPWNCWFEDEFRICENGEGDPSGGGWECWDTATGRDCRTNDPDFPDDRDWLCYDADGRTICTSTGDLPGDGGDGLWDCEHMGEFVICTRDEPEYPDDGGGSLWDCITTPEFRICHERPGDDIPGGGEDVCVPGTQRWCDGLTYCSWARQTCLPDGNAWTTCLELPPLADGRIDRPENDCGCRNFIWNTECCEDQADRNGDGEPDCIVPDDYEAPWCGIGDAGPTRACDYCDPRMGADACGGGGNLCISLDRRAFFCGTECSTDADCPDASFRCAADSSGTVRQCVPRSGACPPPT